MPSEHLAWVMAWLACVACPGLHWALRGWFTHRRGEYECSFGYRASSASILDRLSHRVRRGPESEPEAMRPPVRAKVSLAKPGHYPREKCALHVSPDSYLTPLLLRVLGALQTAVGICAAARPGGLPRQPAALIATCIGSLADAGVSLVWADEGIGERFYSQSSVGKAVQTALSSARWRWVSATSLGDVESPNHS